MWEPLSRDELEIMISHSEYLLTDLEEKFWNYIKTTPQKWQEVKYGKEGGGFWVVAIFGEQVLYYNDIEEGFNASPYKQYGVIDEYHCSQLELHESIKSLYEWLHHVL